MSDFSSADPPRNFTVTVAERIRAITIGVPAYAARKRNIEDLDAKWTELLVELAEVLAGKGHDEDEIQRRLLTRAAIFDLKKINRLVEIHNRYYPIEANLGMDLRTGEYLIYGRRWSPEELYTSERLVEGALKVLRLRRPA